jgi:hypothetical protein
VSNYTKSTNFAAKDSLPSGNANKVVKGTEINTEFDNIATAIATKADLNSPTLVTPNLGTPSAAVLTNATGLPLTTGVTGTLLVANGGTGTNTFSAGALLKGAGTSAITTATAGTDYAPATSGTAILKGNGTGGFSNAAAGTDYAAATTGTSAQLLANNGSGGFSNVTVGSGLSLSAGTLSNTASVSAATPTTLGTVYGNTPSAGTYGTFLGYQAGNVTTGTSITAIGHSALYSNTTGIDNIAVGRNALYYNQTGQYNVAVGSGSLFNNTVSNNTAVGYEALGANTTGIENVAVGYQTLDANTTGNENAALGYGALTDVTAGVGNIGLGRRSGARITTGSQNICIGNSPGDYVNYLTTGSNNILMGYGTQSSSTGSTHEIVIGTVLGVQGKGNNTGFISPNAGGVYQGNNSSSWSTTSDQRLKKNIVDNTEGLDKISQIRVRNFEYRLPEEVDPSLKPQDAINKSGVQLGVIAQELQQVCPDCVKEESTGVLSVDSDNVFWHMLNAIKELNTRLQAAEAEIATLKGA